MMKSKKPKVVFIHPDLGIGGAERLVLDVAIALVKKNEVSFVTNHFNKNHAFEELKNNQFPVSVIGDWIPRSICGIFQALCSYVRMLYLSIYYVLFVYKTDKPDLFFIDQIPMAVPFIKWTGGKVIYYCHHPDLLASPPGGILKRLYRLPIDWLELKGTAMADVILVNSKYTAEIFKKTFPKITNDVELLYPTISFAYQDMITNFQPVETISDIQHVAKDAFVFLSINRFHPAKKLELAIDALEAVHSKLSANEWNSIHLIMAGGYDPQSSINEVYFLKLVKLCEKKNLMAKVTFLKSPADWLKAQLLMRCNCLIYTPVNEHFGIVPLEAMMAEKPVIACNSGGPCETVLNGITGYLCDPTGDSLADAMSNILRNDTATRLGLMGNLRLQKTFSFEKFSKRINEIVDVTLEIITKDDASTDSRESVEYESDSSSSNYSPRSEHPSQNTSGISESEESDQNPCAIEILEPLQINPQVHVHAVQQNPEKTEQGSSESHTLKQDLEQNVNVILTESQSPSGKSDEGPKTSLTEKCSPERNIEESVNSNLTTVQAPEQNVEHNVDVNLVKNQSPTGNADEKGNKSSPEKHTPERNIEEKINPSLTKGQSPEQNVEQNIDMISLKSQSPAGKTDEKDNVNSTEKCSPERNAENKVNSNLKESQSPTQNLEEQINISLTESGINSENVEPIQSPNSSTSTAESCAFDGSFNSNPELNESDQVK